MKALMIIDVQNDFMENGPLEVPDARAIIPIINALQQKATFDLIIATQDWHPKIHKSFVSNHISGQSFDKIMLNGHEQILWPEHCIQGTIGADFHPQLDTLGIEAIFRKGMDEHIDSYSAFYDNGKQKSTGLAGFLRERKVDTLYFTGLAGDVCVYHSIIDALNEGFKCVLIEDATKSLDRNTFQSIKTMLIQQNVKIINSNDVV